MREWVRGIWHPHYGNWGGASNTHERWDDAEPIDEMDALFRVHDFALGAARSRAGKMQADEDLAEGLRKVDKRELALCVYGHIYLWGCLLVFKQRGGK